jgi:cell wall-associated NlpC family hydrolase
VRLKKGIRLKVGDPYFFFDRRGHAYHVGWYAGGGTCVEARGRLYGVIKTNVPTVKRRGGIFYRFRGIDTEPRPPVTPPAQTIPKTMEKGTRGNGVLTLRRNLAIFPLSPVFDETTFQMVALFQKDAGLPTTGKVDARLFAATQHPATLAMGTKNRAWTRVLQRALGQPDDAHFTPKTAAAVRQYQRRRRLVIDGVCGPVTWKRLRAEGR